MARLSSPIENLKSHYFAVVIGSGYGGGIAASRLARAGQQVCVLERGREFQPGEYPDTPQEVIAESQVDTPDLFLGSRTGLYDVRVNPDINVFLGCGLGGTSLVNAGVVLQADPRVFQDPVWPAELRADIATRLQQGYQHATDMLNPSPYPNNFPALHKHQALETSANALKEKFYSPPINVTFKDGVNRAGIQQNACILCGDCVTGCNHFAKNTVLMNYLPDACAHGAEIYTQVSVRSLEQKDGQWVIHYQFLDSGREAFDAPAMFLTADLVVLAAGTLGSTELLLRSKSAGLSVSDQVGLHFSGNGDVLAFTYDGNTPIDGIGFGSLPPQGRTPVGPCITGVIDERQTPVLDDGMVIEEGSIPGALGGFLPAALAVVAPWAGQDLAHTPAQWVDERTREVESLLCGPYHGAVENTQTYLVMTHDGSAGHMTLENDRLRIHWPGVGDEPIFQRVSDQLDKATQPLGGIYTKDPIWTKLFQHDLISVHPMGGCVMAEDAANGVVNHKGQVFSSANGTAVYDNLYVSDGSVIPRSLGVNPLFTISAVTERCCALMAQDRGWTIDYNFDAKPPAPPLRSEPMGLIFTETMKGFFSTKVTDDYQKGESQGEKDGSSFQFTLTIISDDLNQMVTDSSHAARMMGVCVAPALSPNPLTASDGQFHLFINDPDAVDTRLMTYDMNMTSQEGKGFAFHGFKVIKNDGLQNIWRDTSTLFITISDSSGTVLGKGILIIQPEDFATQMTTMEVTNAASPIDQLTGVTKFGEFFAGVLFDIYGSALSIANEFKPDPSPRKKRPLRLCAPEVYDFPASDGTMLRLTRYKGGTKGPVLLSPGYGTSTLAYTIDTVDTNLPEYLYANKYDVWLFDYRASPALPSAKTAFTLDDVATKDYPAAVAKVREVSGAPDIQVMVHCVGSMTFLMGMLSGQVQGIRSAVCSNLSFYPVSPPENNVKAAFNVGNFLQALGQQTVTTNVTSDNWKDWITDAVLKLNVNGPPCNSAVCRRIWTIYGEVYGHDQLNEATHDAIHEMFGIASITAFDHILLMIKTGHIVDHNGNDVYMPHMDRLKIPLTFLQAAKNHLFLPQGTQESFELLCSKNGPQLYERITVPNYSHMDCFIGKNSAQDIYPIIVSKLDAYNQPAAATAPGATI